MKNLLFLPLLLISCGTADLQPKDEGGTSTESTQTTSTDKLNFEGYVQTAFEIRVDGVEFRDTEHFYTRFRQDLITPNYPEYEGKDIEILGEYGHNAFGARSPVYMSPMSDSGHQFYAVTDTERHFKVVVDKAGTERYRAKIMLRIGLQIEDQKYCYLLHSTINEIVFKQGMPIIFDEFETQLNAWECEDAPEPIEIPSEGGVSNGSAIPGAPEVGTNNITGTIQPGISTMAQVTAAFGVGMGGSAHSYHGASGVCQDRRIACSVHFTTTTDVNNATITKVKYMVNVRPDLISRPTPAFKLAKGLTASQITESFGTGIDSSTSSHRFSISSGLCVAKNIPYNYCWVAVSNGVITGFYNIYSGFIETD
jgi:hypothetical protein